MRNVHGYATDAPMSTHLLRQIRAKSAWMCDGCANGCASVRARMWEIYMNVRFQQCICMRICRPHIRRPSVTHLSHIQNTSTLWLDVSHSQTIRKVQDVLQTHKILKPMCVIFLKFSLFLQWYTSLIFTNRNIKINTFLLFATI